jgi:hypothetical protein
MPIGISLKNRRVGIGEAGVVIPAGPTVHRPTHPIFGSIRFNLDSGRVEVYNGTQFVNLALEGLVDISVSKFNGDGSTTTFGPMVPTVNNPEDILVFVGNIWQAPVDNYTISVTNELELPFAPAVGIDIHVIHNINSNVTV